MRALLEAMIAAQLLTRDGSRVLFAAFRAAGQDDACALLRQPSAGAQLQISAAGAVIASSWCSHHVPQQLHVSPWLQLRAAPGRYAADGHASPVPLLLGGVALPSQHRNETG